jgi:enoyl-CoA hydratase
VKRALIPFAGSLARLPRQIPLCMAMEMLLTGEPIGAIDAQRGGLVNRVVPADRLLETAYAVATSIARNGPVAVRAVKRTVVAASGVSLAAAYELEDRAKAAVMASEDAREGPRAFMEKRAPAYLGR